MYKGVVWCVFRACVCICVCVCVIVRLRLLECSSCGICFHEETCLSIYVYMWVRS